jgi:hypothetical protein
MSSDLLGVNPATLNGMLLYYRLMTKCSGLGDITELSRVGLSQLCAWLAHDGARPQCPDSGSCDMEAATVGCGGSQGGVAAEPSCGCAGSACLPWALDVGMQRGRWVPALAAADAPRWQCGRCSAMCSLVVDPMVVEMCWWRRGGAAGDSLIGHVRATLRWRCWRRSRVGALETPWRRNWLPQLLFSYAGENPSPVGTTSLAYLTPCPS